MTCRRFLLCCLLACLSLPTLAIDKVIIDAPENEFDRRNDYTTQLLRTILDRTVRRYGPYRLSYAPEYMNRGRLFEELKKGETVNVAAKATQPQWENGSLLTIRIPVDKGISEYRLFLINREDQDKFSRITSLAALKQLPLGVEYAWSTRSEFEAQGFAVVSAGTWEGLYKMLQAHRFDYLPRALNEIFVEYDDRHTSFPQMAVENSLLLHFPLPKYFFVSPRNPGLARRIKEGFLSMIRDGSFDQMFLAYHGPMIERAHLCSRRLLEISKSPQPARDRQAHPEYWYNPYFVAGGKPNPADCRR
jgi:hypothetical protein